MNHSVRENQPELLDQLCQAIAAQEVPPLASEPIMPWEQSETSGSTRAKTEYASVEIAQSRNALARRTSWRGRGLTMSVVAAVVLVCGFFALGLPDGNSAFAQVQEAASKIRSLRFRMMEYQGDRDPKVTSVVMVSGVGERSESSDGTEVVSDYKSGKRLSLDHRSKSAVLAQSFESPASLDQLWGRFLALPSDKVKKLESGMMDGKSVNRFEVQENGKLIVSVDPATNLPVRMEMEVASGLNDSQPYRHVATDFIFNSAVDLSLLSTTPPAEYQLTESSRPSGRKVFDESDLIVSSEHGIGGVALGSSKEAILAKLGQPDSIRETIVPGREIQGPDNKKTKLADTVLVEMQYPSDGFDLTIGPDGLKNIHCYGKQVRGAMARDFVGKTDIGIKLGATRDEVIAKYGQPEVRPHKSNSDFRYFHKGYRFVFTNEKLTSIMISPPMSKDIIIKDKGNGTIEFQSP
jgi:outer membrane lipoprotein-sorting protein